MSLRTLRDEVFKANSLLAENGLTVLTWGNASGIDRERGLVVIKPSGVSYNELRPEDLTVVDLDGKVAEGRMRPSSDTPTHLALYRAWPGIGGVAHTHSIHAASFAQACRSIPCFGVTHANFCPGDIPCVPGPAPGEEEGGGDNPGKAVVEYFAGSGLCPREYPGVLLARHGPFTWGKSPVAAADNALIVENIAHMAWISRDIDPGLAALPEPVRRKYYSRQHGDGVPYGRKYVMAKG